MRVAVHRSQRLMGSHGDAALSHPGVSRWARVIRRSALHAATASVNARGNPKGASIATQPPALTTVRTRSTSLSSSGEPTMTDTTRARVFQSTSQTPVAPLRVARSIPTVRTYSSCPLMHQSRVQPMVPRCASLPRQLGARIVRADRYLPPARFVVSGSSPASPLEVLRTVDELLDIREASADLSGQMKPRFSRGMCAGRMRRRTTRLRKRSRVPPG